MAKNPPCLKLKSKILFNKTDDISPFMKKIYIIPGLGESTKDKVYRKIVTLLKSQGWETVSINIKWNRTTAKDWLEQVSAKIKSDKILNPHVLGFSFGAYVAVLLSQELKFKKIICCSLSPYFKEDLKNIHPEVIKYFGIRRINDFKNYSFPKKPVGEIVFFVGDKEPKISLKRTNNAYKKWSGKKSLKIIKGAYHNLSQDAYKDEIVEYIKSGNIR